MNKPATPSCSAAPSPTAPLAGASDDQDLRALLAVVEGTAAGTGQEFFRSLVRHLAAAINVDYAVVGEFRQFPVGHVHACWERGQILEHFDYDCSTSPSCEVLVKDVVHYSSGVLRHYPRAAILIANQVEGYLAVPLRAGPDNVLGFLSIHNKSPLPEDPRRLSIMRIFAARATAELQRIRAEQRLQESEARYRDLYENAPNAYLIVGMDGLIVDVNCRVTSLLGYRVDELVGQPIHSFLPDTPAGRPRSLEVQRRYLAGESVSGWEMEMRRKDGSPLWIKMWMVPGRRAGPDGALQPARSFFYDITDLVLAEQERARLKEQNVYLQEEIKSDHNFEQIIGKSVALLEVLAHAAQVAPTDATVLISGETGTGKELIARAIHSASRRKDKPLIKVNCAALPAGLVESELFGHEKGAFSGAIARRLGRFELADGGTIFLDEIGELPAETQAKLLRALQEREFDRVGGGKAPVKVDVRVIAATNRDLLGEVSQRRFREDLYYRLNVFPIRLPPLRQRPDDIPLLVRFLVGKFAARIGKQLQQVGQQTMARLAAYPWPGNVRELENVLERAVILANGPTLEVGPDVLPAFASPLPDTTSRNGAEAAAKAASESPSAAASPATAPQPTLEAMERQYILDVLRKTNWLITGPRGAALMLGMNPSTLRSRLKKLGISRTASV
jgi:PAS domain S-box-containing protein